MGLEFHVNGLAMINWGASQLGYANEAGVQVELDFKTLPVFTDAFGDQVPEDIQNMGMLGRLSFELVKYDSIILHQLQTALNSTAANVGKYPNVATSDASSTLIGALLKQCSYMQTVAISRYGVGCETKPDGPYSFNACYLGPDAFNLGTRATRHRMTIEFIPDASGVLFVVASGLSSMRHVMGDGQVIHDATGQVVGNVITQGVEAIQ